MVVLENRSLRVVVLPGQGADIVEFRHKPSDTDYLWRSPWPLRPPGSPAPWTDSPAAAYLMNYPGGWQELFPTCGNPANFSGLTIGVHGEVCRLPWRWWVEEDKSALVSLCFEVETVLSPFRLQRRMIITDDKPSLQLDERVVNLGAGVMEFMWGHHPAFGSPFLKEGCRIDSDAATVLTSSIHNDPASRLRADQKSSWPHAALEDGSTIDLSRVGAPTLGVHDWAYLTDFTEGWFAITEPTEGVGFACRWPAETMPYLLYWQNYRGARSAPWYGRAYTVGLEPHSTFPADFASGRPLLRLGAGESLELRLVASAYDSRDKVSSVDAEGVVN